MNWWERVLYWLYGFFLGPFLVKHEDGTITGAMTRWAVAFFTGAMFYRLVSDPGAPLGWADAFTVFFILFALPIDGAMTRLARRDPGRLVGAVTGMFGGGDRGSSIPSYPTVAAAPESGPGIMRVEELLPPVSQGRPADEESP